MASRYERRCSERVKEHWEKNLGHADALTLRKLMNGMRRKAVEEEGFWTRDRRWLYERAALRLGQLESIGLGGRRREGVWDPVKEMEKQAASAEQRAKLSARWEELKDVEVPRPEPKWHQKWAQARVERERKHGCSLRRDVGSGDWF